MSSIRSIKTMLGLAFSADPARAVASFFLISTQSVAGVLNAYWLKLIADGVIARSFEAAMLGVAGLIGSAVVNQLSNWFGFTISAGLQEKTSWLIDRRLMILTAGLPGLEHHERPEYLKELDLLRQQRHWLGGAVTAMVSNFGTLVQMVGSGVLLASLHPLLLLLPLFAVPSLLLGGRVESMRQKVREDTVEQSRKTEHLFELSTTAGPAKEIRIFSLAEELLSRHRDLWEDIGKQRQRSGFRGAALTGLGWFVFALGYTAAIGYVLARAISGRATPGDVLMGLTLTAQINQQVSAAVDGVNWLLRNLKAVNRYHWLLEYSERSRADSTNQAGVPYRLESGVDFKGVSFTYPGTETEVLSDVNLHIPAGSTLAIIGDNGVGKTTLVKLLCRFYEPTRGSIQVDGIDLRSLEVEEWRSRMAGGFQDFIKFELIARHTIGIGDLPNIDNDPAVQRALEHANATSVPRSLPHGLETQLGRSFESGAELSVGQWQKLALGRAMMRIRPLVMILDEPTSSLDAQTEHALFARYAGAARRAGEHSGAITILVSHRFSTVRMADLIAVVDQGRIVELGSHNELIARKGLYAELYELQARGYR